METEVGKETDLGEEGVSLFPYPKDGKTSEVGTFRVSDKMALKSKLCKQVVRVVSSFAVAKIWCISSEWRSE